jgi:hypothetical protein
MSIDEDVHGRERNEKRAMRLSACAFCLRPPTLLMSGGSRRAILAGIRNHGIRITHKTTLIRHNSEDEKEF